MNEIEIYFSVVEPKVTTPNDFASLNLLADPLLAFERYYKALANPFVWSLPRRGLNMFARRMAAESLASLRPMA